jgi:lipid-binding SYLF domain-containing protein
MEQWAEHIPPGRGERSDCNVPATMEEHSMNPTRRSILPMIAGIAGAAVVRSETAHAASARELNTDANEALRTLYATQPKARVLATGAKGILIFPKIIKAGLIIGGQSGDGVLWVDGHARGYYNISAASFGLQAGAQSFSYALFFITDKSLDYLQRSDGWAIGTGPSVVVVDKSAAASLTSTTLSQDVYAFPFGGRGLMAGIGLEGSKITRIHPGA